MYWLVLIVCYGPQTGNAARQRRLAYLGAICGLEELSSQDFLDHAFLLAVIASVNSRKLASTLQGGTGGLLLTGAVLAGAVLTMSIGGAVFADAVLLASAVLDVAVVVIAILAGGLKIVSHCAKCWYGKGCCTGCCKMVLLQSVVDYLL